MAIVLSAELPGVIEQANSLLSNDLVKEGLSLLPPTIQQDNWQALVDEFMQVQKVVSRGEEITEAWREYNKGKAEEEYYEYLLAHPQKRFFWEKAHLPERPQPVPKPDREYDSDLANLYTRRVDDLREQILGCAKAYLALSCGYQPYHFPDGWFAGSLNRSQGGVRRREGSEIRESQFNSSLPLLVIEKVVEARNIGCFDYFVVAAPDERVFSEPRVVDPIVAGLIRTGGPMSVTMDTSSDPTIDLRGGVAFLIAMWGLKEDRQTSGMDF